MSGRRQANRKTIVSAALAAGVMIAAAAAPVVVASPREAARHVRQGIRHHQNGDYQAAQREFARAAELLPDDPRITFDQACVLAAQDQTADAEALFRAAAQAGDTRLVADSHYNLGCLAARQARALWGGRPEEAVGQAREEGLQLLRQAIASYRDGLRVQPDHQPARRNLELLRLFIKHLQDQWAERDRQRRREQMNLLEFLDWLRQQQRSLRAAAHAAAGTASSPRQRQAVAEAEAAQRELAAEIEPLRQKLRQAQAPPPGSATAAPAEPSDRQLAQAVAALCRVADVAEREMRRAADELAGGQPTTAVTAQSAALAALNEIYEAVAPFEAILKRAVETQRRLVAASRQAVETPPAAAPPTPDPQAPWASADQQRVGGWAEVLAAKATWWLAQRPPTDAAAEPDAEPDAEPSRAPDPSADAVVRLAYEKAVELGPRIAERAADAASHLADDNLPEALPSQQEALRLLEQIAERVPPPPRHQDDRQQDQDQNQDPQQQQQDQPPQQQDQPQQEPEQQQKQPPGQQDEKSDDQQPPADQQRSPQDEQPGGSSPEPPSRQPLTRQQAEALLRQVRQREREHRQRQKEIQRLLRAGTAVERDW